MSGNALLFVLFFVGCIGVGILWEVLRRKCTQCGKFFAREIVSSGASFRNDFHDNAMKKTTVSDCRCKFCGHTWTQRYTSTKHKH
jgi:hypothetical protein